MRYAHKTSLSFLLCTLILSCTNADLPSSKAIGDLNLKTGDIVTCGATNKQFGTVAFDMTCDSRSKEDFNLAVELLHSFEYDESEKAFARVIDKNPGCAMAYWGVAMCNFHALWTPPTPAELEKGSKALQIANNIQEKSERETAYINALGQFYSDWTRSDHHTRCLRFATSMENLYKTYPTDHEAAIFYALALDAAADPTDKTYANQKKAAALLNGLYEIEPSHPGIIHYLIHTYDYPGMAILGLPAARKYATVAPSSAHALHMPSHIFTRLGLWDDCINSNIQSVSAAKCYAAAAALNGVYDEELHGMDYLIYAWLQKGNNKSAEEQLAYLNTINSNYPINFKVAYAFAAIPSRLVLENRKWKEAAALKVQPANFPWKGFPWQEAIIHFTRLMGAVHIGATTEAKDELKVLNHLRDTLDFIKDAYKTKEVEIQIKMGAAWIQFASGDKTGALALMQEAASLEDGTEKHPVTPGEVLPARELLGDMLFEMHQYAAALEAYEAVLVKCPNRFNSLNGAALAAQKTGNVVKATAYSVQLLKIVGNDNAQRPELVATKSYLLKHT